MTADSILAEPVVHPARFAARLVAAAIDTPGSAVPRTQAALRSGREWWQAADPNSAGTSGAARCAAFGLVWAGDPRRAAYEAAVSTAVTHGHPSAISGSAAFAAAVALAATGDGPLNSAWLVAVADICSEFTQVSVNGATVLERLRLLPSLEGLSADSVLNMLGTGPIALEAVPAALWCAANASDPASGLLTAVNAGGDTDAVAGMAGACLGARHGATAWPTGLSSIGGLAEVTEVADRIAGQATSPGPVPDPKTEDDTPVHVSFLIDRSGSMKPLVLDVVGGFNEFITKQRELNGDCTLTLVQFDSQDPFEVVHDAAGIDQVPDLTRDKYQPRGLTPLLDALGMLIQSVDKRAGLDQKEDQIVVVFSDGLENASSTWTRTALFDLIKARETQGWTFVFLGANQDVYHEASSFGFNTRNTQAYRGDSVGARHAMREVNRAVSSFRSSSWEQKQVLKNDIFGGDKFAEDDHLNR